MQNDNIPNDPIINPADANNNNNNNNNHDHVREEKIKSLAKQLRMINNLCDSIDTYSKFQTCVIPEIKVVSDLNVAAMLISTAGTIIRSNIDDDLLSIKDPPKQLDSDVAHTYNKLDDTTTKLLDSLSQTITILQNKFGFSNNNNNNVVVQAVDDNKQTLPPRYT